MEVQQYGQKKNIRSDPACVKILKFSYCKKKNVADLKGIMNQERLH